MERMSGNDVCVYIYIGCGSFSIFLDVNVFPWRWGERAYDVSARECVFISFGDVDFSGANLENIENCWLMVFPGLQLACTALMGFRVRYVFSEWRVFSVGWWMFFFGTSSELLRKLTEPQWSGWPPNGSMSMVVMGFWQVLNLWSTGLRTHRVPQNIISISGEIKKIHEGYTIDYIIALVLHAMPSSSALLSAFTMTIQGAELQEDPWGVSMR